MNRVAAVWRQCLKRLSLFRSSPGWVPQPFPALPCGRNRLYDGLGLRSASIRFTKAAMARILMRASAFNCRRVTAVRKSGRRGRLERGDRHGRVGRRGKKRRADLAWRRREDLRLSCAGSPRNDKHPHQRSSQKEHAVCLHAVQIYDRSKRNVSPNQPGLPMSLRWHGFPPEAAKVLAQQEKLADARGQSLTSQPYPSTYPC